MGGPAYRSWSRPWHVPGPISNNCLHPDKNALDYIAIRDPAWHISTKLHYTAYAPHYSFFCKARVSVKYSCTRLTRLCICVDADYIDGLFQPLTLKIGMHIAVDSIRVCTKRFLVRSLRNSAPEIRSSLYSAQMRASHHQISNISVAKRRRTKSFGNGIVRLLIVLHIAMCVPIFSFIGLNAAKIDPSKVVYKNTQRSG